MELKIDFTVGMGRNERISEIVELAKVAEESGFSAATFVDQPIISRDVIVMLTLAAANTSRIRLGQGVTDPVTYPPLVIANSAASLYELTGGRFFVGIGAGGPFGKVMKPVPLHTLRKTVEFVKEYTSGQNVELDGQSICSEYSRSPVPVYMGSVGPKSLQLAGEIADGVIVGPGPIPEVEWRLEQIAIGADRVGRDPSTIDICLRAMIHIADSKEAAFREMAGYTAATAVRTIWLLKGKTPEIEDLRRRLERGHPGLIDEYKRVHDVWEPSQHELVDTPGSKLVTQRMIDQIHISGTVDDVCEGIYRRGEIGVRSIGTATYTIADKKGMMREIGDKIMPHFRN